MEMLCLCTEQQHPSFNFLSPHITNNNSNSCPTATLRGHVIALSGWLMLRWSGICSGWWHFSLAGPSLVKDSSRFFPSTLNPCGTRVESSSFDTVKNVHTSDVMRKLLLLDCVSMVDRKPTVNFGLIFFTFYFLHTVTDSLNLLRLGRFIKPIYIIRPKHWPALPSPRFSTF